MLSCGARTVVLSCDIQTLDSHGNTNIGRSWTYKHWTVMDIQTLGSHGHTNTEQSLTYKHWTVMDIQTLDSHGHTNIGQSWTYKHLTVMDMLMSLSCKNYESAKEVDVQIDMNLFWNRECFWNHISRPVLEGKEVHFRHTLLLFEKVATIFSRRKRPQTPKCIPPVCHLKGTIHRIKQILVSYVEPTQIDDANNVSGNIERHTPQSHWMDKDLEHFNGSINKFHQLIRRRCSCDYQETFRILIMILFSREDILGNGDCKCLLMLMAPNMIESKDQSLTSEIIACVADLHISISTSKVLLLSLRAVVITAASVIVHDGIRKLQPFQNTRMKRIGANLKHCFNFTLDKDIELCHRERTVSIETSQPYDIDLVRIDFRRHTIFSNVGQIFNLRALNTTILSNTISWYNLSSDNVEREHSLSLRLCTIATNNCRGARLHFCMDSIMAVCLQAALFESRISLDTMYLVDCIGYQWRTNPSTSQIERVQCANKRIFSCIIMKQENENRSALKYVDETSNLRRLMNHYFSDNVSTNLQQSEETISVHLQIQDTKLRYYKTNKNTKTAATDQSNTENAMSDEINKHERNEHKPGCSTLKYLFSTQHMPVHSHDGMVSNVLDPILKQLSDGSNPGPRETMRYELLRVCTFRDYPKDNKPYIIRLAAAGFYYSSNGDEVACFCCGVRKRDWTANCVPLAIHKRISPRCSFLTRNSEVNCPVPELSAILMEKFAVLKQLIEESHNDEDESYDTVISAATQHNTSYNGQQNNNQYPFANNIGVDDSLQNDTDPPKYPHYGIRKVRLDSFCGWPTESSQDPEMLAEAGFYFAGMGDCVRCFYCGVGLRHWSRDDNPWIEHARWTIDNPCRYLIKKKGVEYVELIRMAVDISNGVSNNSAHESNGEENSPLSHDDSTPESERTGEPASSETEMDRSSKAKTAAMEKNSDTKTTKPSVLQTQRGGKLPSKSVVSQTGRNHTAERRRLENENERLRDQTMCKVCFERNVCIVFLPCGHLVTCAECAPTLRVCPVCRQIVKGTVKTYMS